MKKITFNDRYGLTTAVLQGRKTMTRRICKEHATGQLILTRDVESFRFYPKNNIVEFLMKDGTIKVSVPPYKDNEAVAVTQSYKSIHEEMTNGDYGDSKYDAFRCAMVAGTKGWSNKMFVRANLMPHQIQITDINIERLQDISEEDCLKEGIQEYFPYIDRDPTDKVRTFRYFKEGKIRHCISPASKCFAYLIDDISGKGTWQSNPFVVAYSFKLIK